MLKCSVPLALAAVFAPTLALAEVEAGFDCTKAASPTEIAICADPELASADRAMAMAYAALIKRADDPAFAEALRQDQRAFLQWRSEAYETARRPDLAPEQLYFATEGRDELLNWISPETAPGFDGSWANAWGRIKVETRPNGTTHVSAEAADQANGSWLCGYEGEVQISDDEKTQERAVGWTLAGDLILQRKGAMLEVPVAFCDETGPATDGSLMGLYFRVGAPE